MHLYIQATKGAERRKNEGYEDMIFGIGKNREEPALHLTDKHHPGIAVFSFLLAFVSIVLFGVACYQSGLHKGNAGIYVGIMGIISTFLAMAGFVLAWIALRMNNIRTVIPTIASLVNGLVLIFYIVIYMIGSV